MAVLCVCHPYYHIILAAGELDDYVDKLTRRISSIPKNQLLMCKTMVNQVTETSGCSSVRAWFLC